MIDTDVIEGAVNSSNDENRKTFIEFNEEKEYGEPSN